MTGMSGGSGYTVTPSIYYDESGQEIVTFDDASVHNNDYRQNIIDDFNNNNESYIVEHADGSHTHAFDIEDSFKYSDDYVEEQTQADFYVDDISDADRDLVQNQVGGEERYQEIMEWASENLDESTIEDFDAIIDTGDVEAILQAVEAMEALYEQDGGDQQLDIDQDDIDVAMAMLTSEEPQGLEEAMGCLEDAYEYQQAGDISMATALQASAAFHRGEMNAETAINWVIDSIGMEEAIRCYQLMEND